MDDKTCRCLDLRWECWIKEYDSDQSDFTPALWFSTECASCGKTDFKPHCGLDESAIPKEVLERGLKGLKMWGEGKPVKE